MSHRRRVSSAAGGEGLAVGAERDAPYLARVPLQGRIARPAGGEHPQEAQGLVVAAGGEGFAVGAERDAMTTPVCLQGRTVRPAGGGVPQAPGSCPFANAEGQSLGHRGRVRGLHPGCVRLQQPRGWPVRWPLPEAQASHRKADRRPGSTVGAESDLEYRRLSCARAWNIGAPRGCPLPASQRRRSVFVPRQRDHHSAVRADRNDRVAKADDLRASWCPLGRIAGPIGLITRL